MSISLVCRHVLESVSVLESECVMNTVHAPATRYMNQSGPALTKCVGLSLPPGVNAVAFRRECGPVRRGRSVVASVRESMRGGVRFGR